MPEKVRCSECGNILGEAASNGVITHRRNGKPVYWWIHEPMRVTCCHVTAEYAWNETEQTVTTKVLIESDWEKDVSARSDTKIL